MARVGSLIKDSTGDKLIEEVVWCDSYFCKLAGLMFRKELGASEGLILVEKRASRSATAIHMLFMAFPIAVVWLDSNFEVVDTVLAKRWRPAYAPSRPAQYTLEAHPDMLSLISVGDILRFEDRTN